MNTILLNSFYSFLHVRFYFNDDNAEIEANRAVNAANNFKLQFGAIIYFAVDYDAQDAEIDNIIIPYFASGDYFSGTVAGCSKLMELASGEISVHREDKSEFSLFGLLGLFIMFSILFFIILGRGNGDDKGGNNGGHGGPADDILKGIIIGSMLGGGRDRNGWGGHSGGYGGGDFGGFGGFGGGDFGGGGASGRW